MDIYSTSFNGSPIIEWYNVYITFAPIDPITWGWVSGERLSKAQWSWNDTMSESHFVLRTKSCVNGYFVRIIHHFDVHWLVESVLTTNLQRQPCVDEYLIQTIHLFCVDWCDHLLNLSLSKTVKVTRATFWLISLSWDTSRSRSVLDVFILFDPWVNRFFVGRVLM